MPRLKIKRKRKRRQFNGTILYWVSDYHYKSDAIRRLKVIKRLGHEARVVSLGEEKEPMRWSVYASREYLAGYKTTYFKR